MRVRSAEKQHKIIRNIYFQVKPKGALIIKFFVPFTSDDIQAETAWEATAKWFEEESDPDSTYVTERRIFCLKYKRWGQEITAMVGQPHGISGEPVITILEANIYARYTYVVCTSQGDYHDDDFLHVSAQDVFSVEDFTEL